MLPSRRMRRPFRGVLVDIDDHDLRAFSCINDRTCAADSAPASGNEHNLVFE